jgi:hypothetical protein
MEALARAGHLVHRIRRRENCRCRQPLEPGANQSHSPGSSGSLGVMETADGDHRRAVPKFDVLAPLL